jgi:hypothetical protein
MLIVIKFPIDCFLGLILGQIIFIVSNFVSCLTNLMSFVAVSQHNKEWKPKSSQKTNNNGPGVIGTPKKTVSSPAENSKDIVSDTAQLQDKLSQMNLFENQNVIIAQHIRVPETDRRRLTFGTIGVGTELDSLSYQSQYQLIGATDNLNGESTTRLAFIYCI